ncbi:sensor histidine kinase [Enemella sp. A6]|uniref:sensor histidine kinase n=1 Tax=Enemella sp. A6 TaxID=3440152 RepID=UPI003EBE1268
MKQGAGWLRSPMVAAAATGAWLFAYLPMGQPWAWVVFVLGVLAVVLQAFLPLLGAALMLTACVLCALSGTIFGEIELLLPQVFILFWLGRRQSLWMPGALLVLGTAACASVRPEAPWYALLVTGTVYSVPLLFGRVVRHRAREADVAADRAARLAGIDLAGVMDNTARESRRTAAQQSLRVMRASVKRMCGVIRRVQRTGDVPGLSRVRDEAEAAIQELHRILNLLGAKAAAVSDPPTLRTGMTAHPSVARWSTQATLITAAAAFVCVLVTYLAAGWQWRLVLLAVVVPVGAYVAGKHVVPAGVAVGAAFTIAALGPEFNHWALLPIEGCLAVVVWVTIGHHSRQGLIAFLAAFSGVFVMGTRFGKEGMGFALVSVGLSVLAARAWREKDDRLQEALLAAARRTAEIATAALHVDRDERHRLARDIHDGVSHGITAMTMQVQAAQVATDQELADRHLAAALTAGEATLSEITAIARDWGAGAAVASRSAEDVAGLIEGAKEMGLNILHRRMGDCADPLVFQIVREALTNTVRYAPGARVMVETGSNEGRCRVRIVDTGPARDPEMPAKPLPGLGTGLRGLASRVAERGGAFRAEPRIRGFELWAEWPNEAVADPVEEPLHDEEQPVPEDVEQPVPEEEAVPETVLLGPGPGRPLEAV